VLNPPLPFSGYLVPKQSLGMFYCGKALKVKAIAGLFKVPKQSLGPKHPFPSWSLGTRRKLVSRFFFE
jgi:hypothetical protein